MDLSLNLLSAASIKILVINMWPSKQGEEMMNNLKDIWSISMNEGGEYANNWIFLSFTQTPEQESLWRDL